MSSKVQELRNLQVEIRRTQNELGVISNELKNHPDKPKMIPGERIEPAAMTKWNITKATIAARRTPLQLRLLDLQNRRDVLSLSLKQEPLSAFSLGKIIDELTEIEAKFSEESAGDAWSALTSLIDQLEYDEKRLNVEEQVKKVEDAA